MAKDRRLSVRMIAEEKGLDKSAVHRILTDHLRVHRVQMDIADEWVLHHDNAPAHTAPSVREFLAKRNIPILPHPLYSPDLVLCDFYLFTKLKLKLKAHHFGMMENIQKVVTDELHTLTENDSRYCYDQWKKRWNHCVASQGSYFEGDNL